MKITTKGRYALCILTDLAQHQHEKFVPLKDIAERQQLSKKYLEQIVPLLTKANLLQTNRGYQGGYALAKKPDQYTVGEILRVSEGELFSDGLSSDEYDRTNDATVYVWKGLNTVITDYLYSVTLQDLVDNVASSDNYCI